MTTYSAVVTTGIYCRPGCSARPLAENVRLFELPAAAEAAGFRACHRCRPYRVAGPVASAEPGLVCQAVQLIIGGALDDGGTEQALAAQVGLSARHLRRLFARHLGATPDQLARSRRAHFARRLLDDTDLTVIEVAFAAGFGSLRQFNRAMHGVFGAVPTDLRRRRRRADRLAADGGLELRLPVLPGYDWDTVLGFLAARAIPGVEDIAGATYRRTISVDGAPGLLEVEPGGAGNLLLRVHLPYWEGLIHLVGRAGQLLGTDFDHARGTAALCADPVLGPVVRQRPGLPVPGAWTTFEVGVWAILHRAHDRPAADRWLRAIVTGLGTPVPGLPGGLTHVFPAPARVRPATLAPLRLPAADARAVLALAAAGDRRDALAPDPELREYLAFRTGRGDALPLADASLQAGLTAVGLPVTAASAERWRPWRALAAAHLMAHGDARARPAAPGAGQPELVATAAGHVGPR
jgi:AraC family transcriptional regulator, regulatory protein of adaptative response / DNA-3-methyladenine glycosylase II